MAMWPAEVAESRSIPAERKYRADVANGSRLLKLNLSVTARIIAWNRAAIPEAIAKVNYTAKHLGMSIVA